MPYKQMWSYAVVWMVVLMGGPATSNETIAAIEKLGFSVYVSGDSSYSATTLGTSIDNAAFTQFGELAKGIDLIDVSLLNHSVTSLEPIRGLELKKFMIGSIDEDFDLSPLFDMPLESLWFTTSYFSNLNMFHKMDTSHLKSLSISTSAPSLEPLIGIPLVSLLLSYAPNINDISLLSNINTLEELELTYVGNDDIDLSPLSGLNLKYLSMMGTDIQNLEPLRGMPLKTLTIGQIANVGDISPLADLTELSYLRILRVEEEVDLSPIAKMDDLERLDMWHTKILDLDVLIDAPFSIKGLTDEDYNYLGIKDEKEPSIPLSEFVKVPQNLKILDITIGMKRSEIEEILMEGRGFEKLSWDTEEGNGWTAEGVDYWKDETIDDVVRVVYSAVKNGEALEDSFAVIVHRSKNLGRESTYLAEDLRASLDEKYGPPTTPFEDRLYTRQGQLIGADEDEGAFCLPGEHGTVLYKRGLPIKEKFNLLCGTELAVAVEEDSTGIATGFSMTLSSVDYVIRDFDRSDEISASKPNANPTAAPEL